MKYCPYCPLNRCQAESREDCWAETVDAQGDLRDDEPDEAELERIAENVGVPRWERV